MAQLAQGELCACPAALPVLLHLLSALPSTTAHTPRAPQGTAFCRQPDGIISSVGVKLIVTAGTARVELPLALCSVCLQGRLCPRAGLCSAHQSTVTKPRCCPGQSAVMLPGHLHGAARPLPGHTSSGLLWPSNRDCQLQGHP